MASGQAKPAVRISVVDGAEISLREWLGPGNHRPGDRLPPEQEIAAMLGISRGTLRLALERLSANGEIVRRPYLALRRGAPVDGKQLTLAYAAQHV